MKRYISSTFLFLLIQNISIAQLPSFKWAKQFGGDQSTFGYSIATDRHGNVYSTGYFRGTVDFDPGSAVYNLVSPTPTTSAAFISRLDSAGNFIWAKIISGPSLVQGMGIAIDSFSNVYTTGFFNVSADLDPGPATFTLISNGIAPFISKLDSSGNFIWAKTFEGFTHCQSNAIAVDPIGNVYVTGMFFGIWDFDPGTGVYNLQNTPGVDGFICKLDSAGNFVWAQNNLGSNGIEESYAICLDRMGHVYTTGAFVNLGYTLDPNFSALFSGSPANDSIFVCKLDTRGNAQWLKFLTSDSTAESKDIAVDAAGNVYTTGRFLGTMDFDPGPAVFNIAALGWEDLFISKLDADGDFVWVKRINGQLNSDPWESSEALVLDKAGNIYVSGFFAADVDFDPGPGTNTLTSSGSSDAFILKLDPSGNFSGAGRIGGDFGERGFDFATDAENNIYLIGIFGHTVDFDPGNAVYIMTSPIPGAGWATFILKLGDTLSTVPVGLNSFDAMTLDSNVICKWRTVQESNSNHFIVERSIDAKMYAGIGAVNAVGNSSGPIDYSFTDQTAYATGKENLYYRLRTIDNDGHFNYSKAVKIKLKYSTSLHVYPNPVSDLILVEFNSSIYENALLTITDMTAKIIYRQQVSIRQGKNSLPVSVSSLGVGAYVLSVNGSNHYSSRFIKQ